MSSSGEVILHREGGHLTNNSSKKHTVKTTSIEQRMELLEPRFNTPSLEPSSGQITSPHTEHSLQFDSPSGVSSDQASSTSGASQLDGRLVRSKKRKKNQSSLDEVKLAAAKQIQKFIERSASPGLSNQQDSNQTIPTHNKSKTNAKRRRVVAETPPAVSPPPNENKSCHENTMSSSSPIPTVSKSVRHHGS